MDQTSAKDGSNESNVDTKQVVCWKLMVQGWWLIIWIWIAEVRIMSTVTGAWKHTCCWC